MSLIIKKLALIFIVSAMISTTFAQKVSNVTFKKSKKSKKIEVLMDGKPFTIFHYPDSLEKPFLYPLLTASGTAVTRGFPLNPKADDPTDHPHHVGLWFNYEYVNGLDFWNNSYAIPAAKKGAYGWIRTDKITSTKDGNIGILGYHANWTNKAKDILLEESTRFEFSGGENQRIIDRFTTLTSKIDVAFNDVKDGMLGLRLAHELQIPNKEDQKFTDDKGIVTVVKGGTDLVANGNYLSSNGKTGNDVWGTRGEWCKVYGKIGAELVNVAIIDHPKNINYPTFWHARGYGLFAANPLGEKVFTNGKSEKNLKLKKGESITFRYRIVVANGNETLSAQKLNELAKAFGGR